jgi:hypothetical protein
VRPALVVLVPASSAAAVSWCPPSSSRCASSAPGAAPGWCPRRRPVVGLVLCSGRRGGVLVPVLVPPAAAELVPASAAPSWCRSSSRCPVRRRAGARFSSSCASSS